MVIIHWEEGGGLSKIWPREANSPLSTKAQESCCILFLATPQPPPRGSEVNEQLSTPGTGDRTPPVPTQQHLPCLPRSTATSDTTLDLAFPTPSLIHLKQRSTQTDRKCKEAFSSEVLNFSLCWKLYDIVELDGLHAHSGTPDRSGNKILRNVRGCMH